MGKQASSDVYREWLGITDAARPLNYYQLLRLSNFEDDAGKIRAHYNKMSAHVRQQLSGGRAAEASALLDELTRAMLCLTDRRRKKEYDGSLGRAGDSSDRRHSFEDILLGRKILDREKLDKAQKLANAIGVDLRDAVLQQNKEKKDLVMLAYAESVGLPYLELGDVNIDETLAPKLPAVFARQHSCVPVMVDGEKVLVASPNVLPTDVEDEIRLRVGLPVSNVLCTAEAIHNVIGKYYTREAAAAQMGVTSTKAAAAAQAAKPKVDPVERAKFRKNVTLAAFMLTFGSITVLSTIFGWDRHVGGSLNVYLIGAGAGALAAAIGWWRT